MGVVMSSTEWDSTDEELTDDDDDADVGLIGGGGPAGTREDDPDELDEHGRDLDSAPEDDPTV